MTDINQFPLKMQPITPDFLLGQLRIVIVAFLAYGGGKGWFTPIDAGFYLTSFTALAPLIVPWAWSIVANLGTVRVNNGSAAAVVAQVEAVDQNSAIAGATKALVANSNNPNTPDVRIA